MKKALFIAIMASFIVLYGCGTKTTTPDDTGICSIEQTTGDCAE